MKKKITNPILHVCSDYANHSLYSELFSSIHDVGMEQVVYVPVRSAFELTAPRPERTKIKYYARHILHPLHRIMFRAKIKKITNDLLKLENPKRFKLIHAHFLYSDGAVALKLYQKSGVPFVTNIRNTDINSFMRLRPDLRWLMHSIVTSAHALIFLSPAYKNLFINMLPSKIASKVSSRCHVIPNGLSSKWFDAQRTSFNRKNKIPIKILYVGDFSKNKNLISLIRAVEKISKKQSISLTIVGGGGAGKHHNKIDELGNYMQYPWINFLGRINDRFQLQRIYREHDVFAMPSFRETFGIVYIEALSQGLPIVHSKGQGIDGYFLRENVAISVDPYSIDSIANGIIEAAELAKSNGANCIKASESFKWSIVATKYLEVYDSVISKI